MKQLITTFCAATLVGCTVTNESTKERLMNSKPVVAAEQVNSGITPAVQRWEVYQGKFNVNTAGVTVAVRAEDAEALTPVMRIMKEDLMPLGFPTIETSTNDQAAAGSIFLRLAETPLQHGEESYTIEIGQSTIITGNSPAAVFLGTRSLLQMIKAHDGKLPCGFVQDWPEFPRRMMMLDVGRKPWPMPVLKDYVRILAWHRMNELHLHLSDEAFGESYSAIRVQSDVFPGLSATDLCYSKDEIRDLVKFAKVRGITITPEFDMPGHAAPFTSYFKDCMLEGYPNYLDVSNPKTVEMMKLFVDEMIPLFDAPDFHIGTDEYRVGQLYLDKEKKKENPRVAKLHADFRHFINKMNRHIRSRGKNCRIWSGFDHMGGEHVKVDKDVIVDMWFAYNDELNGHNVINSSQFVTYYVPGCHYYGVNPQGLYNSFNPAKFGNNPNQPGKGDPRLFGGKLHVWYDHGPTGYTMTETAKLTLPGIQAISEKLWGVKADKNYRDFVKRAEAILPIPNVTVLDRLEVPHPPHKAEIVLDIPQELTLNNTNSAIALPLANADRADLEYPWTVSMDVLKTEDTGGREVLLSSELVEICADYTHKERITTKFADGTKRVKNVDFTGVGLTRAAGARRGLGSPAETYLGHNVSKSFGKSLELNKWTKLTVVGKRGSNTLYMDGVKIGTANNQMVCPLRYIGSQYGQSFVGKIKNFKVVNFARTAAEIGRAAGLDIPDNLSLNCKAAASVSHTEYGLIASNVTDDDDSSRWSSGKSGKQWLAVDLGEVRNVTGTDITWENAYAEQYSIDVSIDGKNWSKVYSGKGKKGEDKAKIKAVKAWYVRINCEKAATQWGYSIYDFQVLGRK